VSVAEGGGHKRAYSIIDFKRNKFGVPGVVWTIEYDPNRSAISQLVFYVDGGKTLYARSVRACRRYEGRQRVLMLRDGRHALPLKKFPLMSVLNVELTLGRGLASWFVAPDFGATIVAKKATLSPRLPRVRCDGVGEGVMRRSVSLGNDDL
jgi:large subunit ribosomal protein L2